MENQEQPHGEVVESGDLGPLQQIVPDVLALNIRIVNVLFVGQEQGDWVLVDAGLEGATERILEVAEERYGAGRPPQAIVLTHGHFDHVGALEELVFHKWPDVPVYAHPLEMPYLTGQQDYPEPDPSVGGGLVATLSFAFSNSGIDLGDRVQPFPADGSVPAMPGWRWIHTPGHTEGHVSLFRASDRVLIAGDAFITVKQESLLSVLMQAEELHGPPAYFTTDWQAAWESVKRLAALQPDVAYPGHGRPVSGEFLRKGLETLAREFDRVAIPEHGRYVQ